MAAVRGSLCTGTAPRTAEGDTHHLCQLCQQTRLWAPTWHKGPPEGHRATALVEQRQGSPAQSPGGPHRHMITLQTSRCNLAGIATASAATTPQLAPRAHRRMEVVGTCPAAGQGQGCHPPCSPQAGLRKPAVQRCAPQPASLAQRRLGNV